MNAPLLKASPRSEGWEITASQVAAGLFRKTERPIPFSDWDNQGIPQSPLAAAALRDLDDQGRLRIAEAGSILVDHRSVANLGTAEAIGLGLPPPVPFALDIKSTGIVGDPGFKLHHQFVRNGQIQSIRRTGSHVVHGSQHYRIPQPLFDLMEEIQQLNSSKGWDEKIEHLAKITSKFPRAEAAGFKFDQFLSGIRIAHASSFGLDVRLANGEIDFDPIPLGDTYQGRSDTADYLLPPSLTENFQREFRSNGVAGSFVIERGLYLYIDPDLRNALAIVKKRQTGTPGEKLDFLMSPRGALRKSLLADGANELEGEKIDRLFVETVEYSDRIISIGEWLPPSLPFIDRDPNNWLPETFSIVLGGKIVSGSPDAVVEWLSDVKAAISAGQSTVRIGDVHVPANQEVMRVLQALQPREAKPENESAQPSDLKRKGVLVYQVKENFERGEYGKALVPRVVTTDLSPVLKATLRAHQIEGLQWLRDCYRTGWPGVLLADDMGLGKTIQSLAFLSWLRGQGLIGRSKPALIVAPTSLLANWENEESLHLHRPGLGSKLVAYGKNLRRLRIGEGHEAESGSQLLDIAVLANAEWILTTYETVRDFQFSFARIRFGCTIFDEVQKAKNPASRLSASLKSIKSEFSIAMTGTPVENSLADLWTISDIVAPGMLPSLKDFLGIYSARTPQSLERLSKLLLESSRSGSGNAIPAFSLRRMKSDVAKDLPKKIGTDQLSVREMAPLQAEKYSEADSRAQAKTMSMLEAIHRLRSISLHPIDPAAVNHGFDDKSYINGSARLKLAFEILENIRSKNEKALVFLNSQKMQNVLAVLIQRQLGCAHPLIIRGDVMAYRRQEIVNEFGRQSGFGVLILSPRAAGVGLNITAANHVIHLDRWWNPAIEDQCTDRSYRIGQTKDVSVYALAAKHPLLGDRSYDLVLHRILERKRQLSRHIFMPLELQAGDFSDLFENKDEPIFSLSRIDAMTPGSFEEWINEVAIASGMLSHLTKRSNDGGADIVIRDEFGKVTHLIQCKFTNLTANPIDSGLSSDLQRVRASWRADAARVLGITNASAFANSVHRVAKETQARLVSRHDLHKLAQVLMEP